MRTVEDAYLHMGRIEERLSRFSAAHNATVVEVAGLSTRLAKERRSRTLLRRRIARVEAKHYALANQLNSIESAIADLRQRMAKIEHQQNPNLRRSA